MNPALKRVFGSMKMAHGSPLYLVRSIRQYSGSPDSTRVWKLKLVGCDKSRIAELFNTRKRFFVSCCSTIGPMDSCNVLGQVARWLKTGRCMSNIIKLICDDM